MLTGGIMVMTWVLTLAAAPEGGSLFSNGDIARARQPYFDVSLETIVSLLAQNENLVRNIDTRFEARTMVNDSGALYSEYSGNWAYDSIHQYERIDMEFGPSREHAHGWTERYGFNGTEAREWGSQNNTGNFSQGRFGSGLVSTFFAPTVWSSPLVQELPDMTFSEILGGGEAFGIPDFLSPEIIGWETLELAHESAITTVVDVGLKDSSFRVRLWLDAERVFSPRRILQYQPGQGGEIKLPLVDIVIDDIASVPTGQGGLTAFVSTGGRVAGFTPETNSFYDKTTFITLVDTKINQDFGSEHYLFDWPEEAGILNLDTNEYFFNVAGNLVPPQVWTPILEFRRSPMAGLLLEQQAAELNTSGVESPRPSQDGVLTEMADKSAPDDGGTSRGSLVLMGILIPVALCGVGLIYRWRTQK